MAIGRPFARILTVKNKHKEFFLSCLAMCILYLWILGQFNTGPNLCAFHLQELLVLHPDLSAN
jgi:hypothetical protein